MKLASAIVTNFSLPEQELSVLIPVGVSYNSNLERVEQVTLEVVREVIRETPGASKRMEPVVRYYEFADSSINFNIILRASEFTDQYLLRHEIIKKLHQRYNAEGIEIPFPIRTVHIKPAEIPVAEGE